ncbi:eukaryotic translation elongation factor 1 epsilon-1-like [Limulus polyphemus]|uniref:Eukaryotic translation elongation factor 1 epsilon-1-like n=1 Tax=Limulus polyphemus TaxID=6850 RepID=A0ABM1BVM5_LIMPO|nr:eukaryotic translation elongation factor 1 epsilon-1-like [Limulus polyphemus]
MLCFEEFQSLANFLGVEKPNVFVDEQWKRPCVETSAGKQLCGLVSISKYLTDKSHQRSLLGTNIEESSLINQWLEYRTVYINQVHQKSDMVRVLEDLDLVLQKKVYFVGNRLTLADISIYYGLHRIFVSLTFQEKEKYLHLSRWFNQVQHVPEVRQTLPVVVFSKSRLYKTTTL